MIVDKDLNSRVTVMVVGEEPVIQTVLCRTLMREGFNVLKAGNGVEALAKLNGGRIDIILSDVMMSEMDGMELLVSAKSEHPDTLMILITSAKSDFSGRQILEAGADDFIEMPFKSDIIRYTMQRAAIRIHEKRSGSAAK